MNIRCFSFILTILLLWPSPLVSQSFKDATISDIPEPLKVSFTSLGTSSEWCVQLDVKNEASQNITLYIPAGTILISENSRYQDIITTKSLRIQVLAGAHENARLYGFCYESGHFPAPKNAEFYWIGQADANMLKLIEHLSKVEYTPHAQQEAIWCLSSDFDLAGIVASDRQKSMDLRYVVGGILGKEIPWYSIHYENILNHPFRNEFSSLTGTLNFTIEEESLGTLRVCDPAGEFMVNIFENELLKPGSYTQDFELSSNILDPGVYLFQIVVDGKVHQEQRIDF